MDTAARTVDALTPRRSRPPPPAFRTPWHRMRQAPNRLLPMVKWFSDSPFQALWGSGGDGPVSLSTSRTVSIKADPATVKAQHERSMSLLRVFMQVRRGDWDRGFRDSDYVAALWEPIALTPGVRGISRAGVLGFPMDVSIAA